ncbi:glycosyltransferase family 4 protein [Elusimicrobiota bacterium]
MKICLVHGYPLTGTGSNIYVANLAIKLCALGHDVSIMCQEPHPENLDFVSEAYTFNETNTGYERKFQKQTSLKGACRIFRPRLNTLLVFVPDKYEGFSVVQTLHESSQSDIEEFAQKNASALRLIIKDFNIEIIQANHSVMQPYIAHLATRENNIPYFATLHGSALNFSVRKSEFLHKCAMEGVRHAKKVIAVSGHNAREFREYLKEKHDKLPADITVIPVGVDLDKFELLTNKKSACVSRLKENLEKKLKILNHGKTKALKQDLEKRIAQATPSVKIKELFRDIAKNYDRRHPDHDVVETLDGIDWANDKIVLFVGKYLWTKGLQVVITAIPMILKKIPEARFVFVGFGESREILQALVFALARGDKELYQYMLKAHSQIDLGGAIDTPLIENGFLDKLKKQDALEAFFNDAKESRIDERVHFTGIMSHDELRFMLPMADVLVAPSVFPEAFGTVAIEAMAAGVFPIISYQYGFKEVDDAITEGISEDLGDLAHMPKMYIDNRMASTLAENVIAVLRSENVRSKAFKQKCRDLATKNYSWDAVAQKYLEVFSS